MSTQPSSTLYSKIISTPEKINWSDIINTTAAKHTQSDVDYAIVAGTTLDTVQTELGMLQKWQRPWLYRMVFLWGLILSIVITLSICITIFVYGYCSFPSLNLLLIMVPPCIVPMSLMIFFWEMNVPRDISILQLISYFFIGGILSITITTILHSISPEGGAEFAPFTEEPAKLLASLLLLKLLHRKNGRIYGFSGLSLGAAVGAGFAAFESAQYVYDALPVYQTVSDAGVLYFPVMVYDRTVLLNTLSLIAIRNACSLCSHVLFCAPYACIVALCMEKNENVFLAICKLPFLIVFAVSFACHGLWNLLNSALLIVPAAIVLWSSALYGVRKSFRQLADKVSLAGNSSATTSLLLKCISGVHAGITFSVTKTDVLIGNDPSCQLSYPISQTDIDSIHCKIIVQQGNLYLADLGSRNGTYLNGIRLKAMNGHLLKRGDRFSIGSSGQEFQVI